MEFPRILIVGQYFDTRSGGGITMINLFRDWKKENIAVAAEDIHAPDFSICDKYYQLGSLEFKRRFPFNLKAWRKKIKSGIVAQNEDKTPIAINMNPTNSFGIKKMYSSFLQSTGLNNYRRKYAISKEFLSWINEYSPEIIYSQLSSIHLIDFVNELKQCLDIPVAIHIMDDWPLTICNEGVFKLFWHKIADKKFRKLLNNSNVLMSISEAMSDEYRIRYGKNFIPFHNPIDIQRWVHGVKRDYQLNGKLVILYAGRIGTGIRNCFYDIVDAIDSLIKKGLEIEFHLQATNFDPILEDLKKNGFIKLLPPVSYSELPVVFSKADVLLLANDFDNVSISFLKYSMPTKASEYMVSGTPILLYSSSETAVTKHALKYKWAYIVSEKNKNKLESAIYELYQKIELRTELGNIAKEYAINNYDGVVIREQFRRSFILK